MRNSRTISSWRSSSASREVFIGSVVRITMRYSNDLAISSIKNPIGHVGDGKAVLGQQGAQVFLWERLGAGGTERDDRRTPAQASALGSSALNRGAAHL